MKKVRTVYSEEQKLEALALMKCGLTVPEICERVGLNSKSPVYQWAAGINWSDVPDVPFPYEPELLEVLAEFGNHSITLKVLWERTGIAEHRLANRLRMLNYRRVRRSTGRSQPQQWVWERM